MIEAIANIILLILLLALMMIWVIAILNYDPMKDCCKPEDCDDCECDCDDYEKAYRHKNQQIKEERGKVK